ncbi:MAG: BrnA antitoxin family protein [Acidobacteriota bacterium]
MKKRSALSPREKRIAASKLFTSPLSKNERQELAALAKRANATIDYSDAPAATGKEHVVIGRFYRPIKKLVSLRIDADVLDWHKSQGDGYQTRINNALRREMQDR